MTLSNLRINPNLNQSILFVGNEKTPVVILDDFLAETSLIIDDANNNASFNNADTYYPGIRADMPKRYFNLVLNAIHKSLYSLYGIPPLKKLKLIKACYSLITKEEVDLHPLQTIPHFDSTSNCHFAVLHYLSDLEHGGTGIFRHKKTSYERISEHRVNTYMEEVNKAKMSVSQQYISNSTAEYELLQVIDYKPNRLVIYPGNILHSGLLNLDKDINSNPEEGRLTANFFIEYV